MYKAVMQCSCNLVKGADVQMFHSAAKRVYDEFMSKQRGFVSWVQLVDGEEWCDLLTFETMEDAQQAMAAGEGDAANQEFFSFIDLPSVKVKFYNVHGVMGE